MLLISKDSNNRLELSEDRKIIYNASGGTLACHKGPNPKKALSHPAIYDYLLVHYLKNMTKDTIKKDFDIERGYEIIEEFMEENKNNLTHVLLMFQNIVSSSEGSVRYVFGEDLKTKKERVRDDSFHEIKEILDNAADALIREREIKKNEDADKKDIKKAETETLKYKKQFLKEYDGILIKNYTEEKFMENLSHFAGVPVNVDDDITDIIKNIKRHEKPLSEEIKHLLHYNRVFFVKDDTENAMNIRIATASVVNDASRKKRQEEGLSRTFVNKKAKYVLDKSGVNTEDLSKNKDIKLIKITGIEEDEPVIIENGDLHVMDEEDKMKIINSLDIDYYVNAAAESFNKNWKNASPENL